MISYCPRCDSPLHHEDPHDSARLCDVCGWFGDWEETLAQPLGDWNPALEASKALTLYREVCRQEMLLEQLFCDGAATKESLHKVELMRREIVCNMIEMFVALRKRNANPPT
jgi:hypothetical protein